MSLGRTLPHERAGGGTRRGLLSPADNPLVRAVGRLPAGVHAKLLVAFVGTVLLVVVLGLLGLRLLGQANQRVETLRTLQERASAYGKLRSDTDQVRLLLAQNVRGEYGKVWPDSVKQDPTVGGLAIDLATKSAVVQIRAATFPDQLGFRPPAEDEAFLRQIRATGERLSKVMGDVTEPGASPALLDSLHVKAELLAIDLDQHAKELANAMAASTDRLTAQNASSYANSRNLFIGAAAGAIFLALLLGFVLSWSVIGPIH